MSTIMLSCTIPGFQCCNNAAAITIRPKKKNQASKGLNRTNYTGGLIHAARQEQEAWRQNKMPSKMNKSSRATQFNVLLISETDNDLRQKIFFSAIRS